MSPIEIFLLSVLVGGVAELGDKTQLLTVLLSARLNRPLLVAAGMLVATVTQRIAAATIGAWASGLIADQILQVLVGSGFIALAIWVASTTQTATTSFPPEWTDRLSPFSASAAAFFLAEIGDKTQVATVMLAAKFGQPLITGAGTTLGLLIAFVPALLLGRFLASRMHLRIASWSLALVLAVLGVVSFLGIRY